MPNDKEVTDFARETFSSVWSLETALLMGRNPGRSWTQHELVGALRASDLVVSTSIHELSVAGLVVEDANGVRYQPASERIDQLFADVAALYVSSPMSVRRSIIRWRHASINAFSEAFKLRDGEE
ncbi:hypothetical protein [Sphingomonas oligophenolica]|uniref:MarR family transcriptional regulator n=1 Tax=Sphingomonas oligophenolica TaxID=301154 RepID=A0A502BYN3_9SPHN|nr:hypothetical protein [Sphingomonas oligophenolica]TPG05514.1 hypothetical protein EAH84_15110 [Sphingomonas oligophenolica]